MKKCSRHLSYVSYVIHYSNMYKTNINRSKCIYVFDEILKDDRRLKNKENKIKERKLICSIRGLSFLVHRIFSTFILYTSLIHNTYCMHSIDFPHSTTAAQVLPTLHPRTVPWPCQEVLVHRH